MSSKKIKIIADNKIPFLKGALDELCDVKYLPAADITNSALIDADALIIRTRTKCNKELLENTSVKLITTATIGYDHIDTAFCAERGIKWLNAPGCNSVSVMQYITSALLTTAERNNLILENMTIGIIGVGNVGSKIARAADALGMHVLLNDPPREEVEGSRGFCSLETILSESDIITLHVPLIKAGKFKTLHYADENFFSRLKKKIIFINSSRGNVVDSSALKNAVKTGRLITTVLDVWENEPNLDLELMNLTGIATPHIAGYSSDGKANGTAVCVNAVNEFFNLGLKENWYPADVPPPPGGSLVELDCWNLDNQKIFLKAAESAYKILDDDAKLRNKPSDFEKQRNDYIVRREYNSYSLKLIGASAEIKVQLQKLGFNIIT